MIIESIKFIFYSVLIVVISKYILVVYLRKLAENLNLNAKTAGNIAGTATSVPELLTITTSSLRGLTYASIYNILSSNVINLIQYLATIILNRNTSKLKNLAIIFDMILVSLTIIIPIMFLKLNIELDMYIVPLFIICYILFSFLNSSVHKVYLQTEEEKDSNTSKSTNKKATLKYIIVLIITGVLLYVVGNLLGDTLEKLCYLFNVSEFIVGILLGVLTSIPELITFFESQKYNKKLEDEMKGVIEATNNLLTSNIMNLFVIQTIGILLVNFS